MESDMPARKTDNSPPDVAIFKADIRSISDYPFTSTDGAKGWRLRCNIHVIYPPHE
jgi:hypothetical protein